MRETQGCARDTQAAAPRQACQTACRAGWEGLVVGGRQPLLLGRTMDTRTRSSKARMLLPTLPPPMPFTPFFVSLAPMCQKRRQTHAQVCMSGKHARWCA
jgi:hypothetical protein